MKPLWRFAARGVADLFAASSPPHCSAVPTTLLVRSDEVIE
jgi:hypothetical protein